MVPIRDALAQSSYLFFPRVEADYGTEASDALDTERSSIVKDFAAYKESAV